MSLHESAARFRGGDFGIHQNAWQTNEYQNHSNLATDDLGEWEHIGNVAARVLLSVTCRRYGISRPLARTILELRGIRCQS